MVAFSCAGSRRIHRVPNQGVIAHCILSVPVLLTIRFLRCIHWLSMRGTITIAYWPPSVSDFSCLRPGCFHRVSIRSIIVYRLHMTPLMVPMHFIHIHYGNSMLGITSY